MKADKAPAPETRPSESPDVEKQLQAALAELHRRQHAEQDPQFPEADAVTA